MEPFADMRVLIIDDEESICQVLKEIFLSLGIRSKSISDPLLVTDHIRNDHFDVCLLDICMPGVDGLDLVPHLSNHCPEGKIIIMTGYADKEVAIKALKLGAFDFLEKPFEMELIIHAARRALDAVESERNRSKLMEALKTNQEELLSNKKRLERLNEQLMETNRALSVLAQNIALEREQAERQIAFKLKSLVIPVVDKLRQHTGTDKHVTELHLVVNQIIEDLTSGFSRDPTIISNLSPTELRIASLIRNGLSTEEVAGQLNIAPSTVRTHRKNIRKKLKINDTQYSLKNFLQAKAGRVGLT